MGSAHFRPRQGQRWGVTPCYMSEQSTHRLSGWGWIHCNHCIRSLPLSIPCREFSPAPRQAGLFFAHVPARLIESVSPPDLGTFGTSTATIAFQQCVGRQNASIEAVRLASRLHSPVKQDQPADNRDKPQQLPPAAFVDVMQAAGADGQAGQQRCQRKQSGNLVAKKRSSKGAEHKEQFPPPIFRTWRPARKGAVFSETSGNGLGEIHLLRPRRVSIAAV